MERADRAAAGGDINSIPQDNPTRVDFDRQHALSHEGWKAPSSSSASGVAAADGSRARSHPTGRNANAYTLNLKKRMSPSLTTYSLPSDFNSPFSFTACSLPYLNKSSQW